MAKKNFDPDDLELHNQTPQAKIPTKSWSSFWDLGSPDDAANALNDLYGPGAGKAASCCAVTAYADDRDADYRFWCAVYARITASK